MISVRFEAILNFINISLICQARHNPTEQVTKMLNLCHTTKNQRKAAQASSPLLTKQMLNFPYKTLILPTSVFTELHTIISSSISVKQIQKHRMLRAAMAGSVRGLVLAVAVAVSLLAQHGAAKEFTVGGSMSWEVPPRDSAQLYNQWAENNRFMIGDSLVFTYDAGKDSVLLVEKDAYNTCNTGSYSQSFKDGHTVVQLNHSGPFYFISGNEDHCKKHEKLVVVVLSERRKSTPPSPQPAPAPSGEAPTASPPSPSAPGGSSPSPSPSGTSDMVPSSPPEAVSDHKKKNGACSTLLGSLGAFGSFIGTFMVMLL